MGQYDNYPVLNTFNNLFSSPKPKTNKRSSQIPVIKWAVPAKYKSLNRLDILRYIWTCRASAINCLPIDLQYIYKRVSSLLLFCMR